MPRSRLLVLVVFAVLLTSCRTGPDVTMWGTCGRVADRAGGTDGTYALVCRNGTWEPVMTVREFARIAQGHHVDIAPLPHRPTTTTTSTASASTTSSSSTSTTTPPCVESCDGATFTASVNQQPNGTWGYISGTGLSPGATVTLCDSVSGCFPYTTVSLAGTFSVGPSYCCNAPRSSFYAISTTAANGRTITSNSVSHA
jgi:hypothetical protein